MPGRLGIRVGGWSLRLGAVAFMGVFSFLAARFDYPGILDGAAATVLPRLLATGSAGRAVWALHAFLPLVWLPAGVGAVADVNNYLLPLWMIVFGVVLARWKTAVD